MIKKDRKFNLTLGSYHKSKGLEWDFVYLTGVDNKTFPIYLNEVNFGRYYYLKKEYQYPKIFGERELQQEFIRDGEKISITKDKVDKIKEAIRLLYVGITRAKEYLILSGNAENGTFFLEKIGKEVDRLNKIDI